MGENIENVNAVTGPGVGGGGWLCVLFGGEIQRDPSFIRYRLLHFSHRDRDREREIDRDRQIEREIEGKEQKTERERDQ